jgi:hypothetical protein
MPPEMLGRFYEAYCHGFGDFINGSRLVYPMEGDAMRFLNRLGNIFFAKMRIGDSLCGTKLITGSDYQRMVAWRRDFGDFDPFGDFGINLEYCRHKKNSGSQEPIARHASDEQQKENEQIDVSALDGEQRRKGKRPNRQDYRSKSAPALQDQPRNTAQVKHAESDSKIACLRLADSQP